MARLHPLLRNDSFRISRAAKFRMPWFASEFSTPDTTKLQADVVGLDLTALSYRWQVVKE